MDRPIRQPLLVRSALTLSLGFRFYCCTSQAESDIPPNDNFVQKRSIHVATLRAKAGEIVSKQKEK